MVNVLDYKAIEFPVSKKDFKKIEQKNINVFYYKIDLTYPIHISDENLKNCMDLLLITSKNKSHYVYIKEFNRFMCNKTECKSKKQFCR